jgi:hypothetical protein
MKSQVPLNMFKKELPVKNRLLAYAIQIFVVNKFFFTETKKNHANVETSEHSDDGSTSTPKRQSILCL